MNEISDYMGKLEYGEMQHYKNMAMVPLMDASIKPAGRRRKHGLEYLVLDEALDSGLRIEETKHVPELYVENKTGKEVLILMGEYVVGGWQNRMVATNVLLEEGFRGMVPVKCVQQHRWSNTRGFEPYILYQNNMHDGGPVIDTAKFSASAKRATPTMMSASLHEGQGGVWNAVSSLMGSFGTRSATKDIGDVYDHKKHELADYVDRFSCREDMVGMIVATPNGDGSRRYSIELFDKDETMQKQFGKFIESYALEAIAGKSEQRMRARDMKGFFEDVKDGLESGICTITGRKPVSLGSDLEITSPDFVGYSLVHKGMPLYTTFCSEKYRKQEWHPHWETGIRIPRPDPFPRPAPWRRPRPDPDIEPDTHPHIWRTREIIQPKMPGIDTTTDDDNIKSPVSWQSDITPESG